MRVRPWLQLHQATVMLVALGLITLYVGVFPPNAIAVSGNSGLVARSLLSDVSVLAKESPAKLPASVISALRQDVSKRTGVRPQAIRVVESTQKTWPNGCLGLAQPDQMCTQALVNGWRVVLSNGSRRWVYRTNASGKVFRLEPSTQR